ncbi:hypothetical protein DFH29DRAFT_1049395 [Suillus ampliporus]|nr:hypothetical protein DFH29DRAFT_1049395 [Suillus ampliporus]
MSATHSDRGAGEDDLDQPSSESRGLLILYATETGTAQETADRTTREYRRFCRLAEEPMISLWNILLRSDLPDDLFEDMYFSVFGLGDTAYEKFYWPAKKLSRRREVMRFVLGGKDTKSIYGVDGDLDPWVTQGSKSPTHTPKCTSKTHMPSYTNSPG